MSVSPGTLSARALAHFRGRIFYGWYIAWAGAASLVISVGMVGLGLGTIYEPLRKEMHWSAAALTGGIAVRSFEQGFLSPVTGFLVDRFGPRKMALVGTFILAGGLLMFSGIHSLWMYYVAAMVMALGSSLGFLTAFSTAVMSWFNRKRGAAMGIMMSGPGAGYLVVPLMAFLVSELGWRDTLKISALIVLAFGLPMAASIRDRPEAYGLRPDGDPDETLDMRGSNLAARPTSTGFTTKEALRTSGFYFMVVAIGLRAALTTSWTVLQIPHFETAGFSTGTAAAFVGVFGVMQVFLRSGIGRLGDRFGRQRTFSLVFLLNCGGILCFAFVTPNLWWLLVPYYALFASAQAAGAVLQQTVVADLFGTRNFASIRGLAQSLSLPLGVVAPIAAGLTFDHTGSYRWFFVAIALLSVFGAVCVALAKVTREELAEEPVAAG
ncbi:MAG TPA: MFS transporter [Dehalococcoidia bacterium]|nr:MFS transporter [Dehalococcoidia bacterium]